MLCVCSSLLIYKTYIMYSITWTRDPISCCTSRSTVTANIICYLYLSTYAGVQTRFPYQMMFVSFNINRTAVTGETWISYTFGTPECTHGFKQGLCCSIFSCLCSVLLTSINTIIILMIQMLDEMIILDK